MGIGRILGFFSGATAGVGVLAAGAPVLQLGINTVAAGLGLIETVGAGTAVGSAIAGAGSTIAGVIPAIGTAGTGLLAMVKTGGVLAGLGAAAPVVLGIGIVAAAFAVKAVFERAGDSIDAGTQRRQYRQQAEAAQQPQLEQMKAVNVQRQAALEAEQKLAKQGQKMEQQTQKQYNKTTQQYQNMQQQQQQTGQSHYDATQAKRQATAPYHGAPSHHNNYHAPQPQRPHYQQPRPSYKAPPAPNYQQGPAPAGYHAPQQPYYPPPPQPQGRPAHDFSHYPNHPGANNNGSQFQNMENQRRQAPTQGISGQIPMV